MAVIKQWAADPGQPLAIDPEVLARLHYKVTITQINAAQMLCWCEDVNQEGNALTLLYVMVDTSQRFNGVTLRSERALLDQLQFMGQYTAAVQPIDKEL